MSHGADFYILTGACFAFGVVIVLALAWHWQRGRARPRTESEWMIVLENDIRWLNDANRDLWAARDNLARRRKEVPPELHELVDQALRWGQLAEEVNARRAVEQGLTPTLLFGGPVPPPALADPVAPEQRPVDAWGRGNRLRAVR